MWKSVIGVRYSWIIGCKHGNWKNQGTQQKHPGLGPKNPTRSNEGKTVSSNWARTVFAVICRICVPSRPCHLVGVLGSHPFESGWFITRIRLCTCSGPRVQLFHSSFGMVSVVTLAKDPGLCAEIAPLYASPQCARSFIMEAAQIELVWRIFVAVQQTAGLLICWIRPVRASRHSHCSATFEDKLAQDNKVLRRQSGLVSIRGSRSRRRRESGLLGGVTGHKHDLLSSCGLGPRGFRGIFRERVEGGGKGHASSPE